MTLLSNIYQMFRLRAIRILIFALLLAVIAIALNFAGYKTVNTVIGCLIPVLIIILTTNPSIATAVIGLGVISNLKTPLTGSKDAVMVWAHFVGVVLLYESIFFLICGVVPFSRNPTAIPVVFISLFALFLIWINWNMGMGMFRRLIYTYALIVFWVALGSLVSSSTYQKIIGVDPYNFLRVSELEEMVYEMTSLEKYNAEKTTVKKLEIIKKKMGGGQSLTDEEALLWEKTKQQTQEQTLFGNTKRAVSKLLPSLKSQPRTTPPPKPTIVQLDWGENIFPLKKGETTPWLKAGGGDVFYTSQEGKKFEVEYSNGEVLDKNRANDPNLYMPYNRRVIAFEAQTIVITRK